MGYYTKTVLSKFKAVSFLIMTGCTVENWGGVANSTAVRILLLVPVSLGKSSEQVSVGYSYLNEAD